MTTPTSYEFHIKQEALKQAVELTKGADVINTASMAKVFKSFVLLLSTPLDQVQEIPINED